MLCGSSCRTGHHQARQLKAPAESLPPQLCPKSQSPPTTQNLPSQINHLHPYPPDSATPPCSNRNREETNHADNRNCQYIHPSCHPPIPRPNPVARTLSAPKSFFSPNEPSQTQQNKAPPPLLPNPNAPLLPPDYPPFSPLYPPFLPAFRTHNPAPSRLSPNTRQL